VRPEPSPADLPSGLPAGVSEVSRFSCMKFLGVPWGLRPRRTDRELALTFPSMLPSAHFYRVGVRVVCFRGSIPTPPILYLRFTASLAVAAQDSRPSGSLLLSCKALSSSTSCRLSGKAMARTGLRMMPTFPSPPLKFRTAGFPQYGFKAGLSEGAFPARRPIVAPLWFASFLRAPRFQTCSSPLGVGAVVRWSAAMRATVVALPQGSSLRSGFFCPGPSTLNRPHPPQWRAHLNFAALRFI
jgi:hypothetical protein